MWARICTLHEPSLSSLKSSTYSRPTAPSTSRLPIPPPHSYIFYLNHIKVVFHSITTHTVTRSLQTFLLIHSSLEIFPYFCLSLSNSANSFCLITSCFSASLRASSSADNILLNAFTEASVG